MRGWEAVTVADLEARQVRVRADRDAGGKSALTRHKAVAVSVSLEQTQAEWRTKQAWLRRDALPDVAGVKAVIGIDPGAKTGWAQLSVNGEWAVATYDFCSLMQWAMGVSETDRADVVCVIESAKSLPVYAKRHKPKLAVMLSIARDIGANNRESELVIAMLKMLGFRIEVFKPSSDDPKWDAEQCERETGYAGRTNEHVRDAMRFAKRRAY